MRINIEIEKLVLNGFDFHDHRRISRAFKQELFKLIRENGLPDLFTQGDEILQIITPAFNSPNKSQQRIMGTEVARSIYEAWKLLSQNP